MCDVPAAMGKLQMIYQPNLHTCTILISDVEPATLAARSRACLQASERTVTEVLSAVVQCHFLAAIAAVADAAVSQTRCLNVHNFFNVYIDSSTNSPDSLLGGGPLNSSPTAVSSGATRWESQ